MSFRKSLPTSICVVLLLAVYGASPVVAGTQAEVEKNRADVKKMLLANPEKLYSNEFDARGLKPDERKKLAVYRALRDGKKLEKAIFEGGLNLTDLQKKTIHKIFSDQYAYAVETGAAPRSLSGRSRDFLAKPGSRNAPVPANAKSKSGGRAKEINRPGMSPFDDPQALINRIGAELSGDQLEPYGELSERWRVLRPRGVGDGPLRQLMRAATDPELKLDDKVQAECRGILMKSMMSLGRNRKYVDKRLKATSDTQAKLFEKFSPSQRDHFNKTLAEIKGVYAEEIAMLMEWRAEKDKPATAKPASSKP